MVELFLEILVYLAVAALIGLILGYLLWGWSTRQRIEAARADGARSARTSVDGDSGLKAQLDACSAKRTELQETVTRQRERISELEAALSEKSRAVRMMNVPTAVGLAGGAVMASDLASDAGDTTDADGALEEELVADLEPMPEPGPDVVNTPKTIPPSLAEAAGRDPFSARLLRTMQEETGAGLEDPETTADLDTDSGAGASTRATDVGATSLAAGPDGDATETPETLTGTAFASGSLTEAEPSGQDLAANTDATDGADTGAGPADGLKPEPFATGASFLSNAAASADNAQGGDQSDSDIGSDPADGPKSQPYSMGASFLAAGVPSTDSAEHRDQADADTGTNPSGVPKPQPYTMGSTFPTAGASSADSTDDGEQADPEAERRNSDEVQLDDIGDRLASAEQDETDVWRLNPDKRTNAGPQGFGEGMVAPFSGVGGQADAAPSGGMAIPVEPQVPVEQPKSLLTERPAEVDDLKRIKGVGPVMEQVLNDKGVYLFHQVANFSPSDVAWVNEAIEAFPGRIERDEWVRQAQDLYRMKYGRSHDEA